MKLTETKEYLIRLHNKYKEILPLEKKDIAPSDYFGHGISGYSYKEIDRKDKDKIYESICFLYECFTYGNSAILFDIDNLFITESKALASLRELFSQLNEYYQELILNDKRYQFGEQSFYPIKVCLTYYKEIIDSLGEILASNEIKEFESPGKISILEKEL